MSGITPFPLPGLYGWRPPFSSLLSTFGPLLSHSFVWDSSRLFFLGSVIETGRRIFRWVIKRLHLQLWISAEFTSGNPAYQWLLSYLTQEKVSGESRDFDVEAKTSRRRWTETAEADSVHVDYIPLYGTPHLVKWKGYWIDYEIMAAQNGGSILHINLYTRDKSVLFALVEECRLRYVENSKPYVTIFSTDADRFGERFWDMVKHKRRRPLESLVLGEGMLDSLLADTRDFLDKEEWYINTGIPHRRGYLLYGPPGTGKTTTVYAVAAELELSIFTLSLASSGIDDRFLSRAVSFLPPRAIVLIEDIDCAFPSRDDEDELDPPENGGRRNYDNRSRSQVTLSGLLNILDGVGSEEGKIFFATTNHIDYLDPALLRPGRIDRKFEYTLSSKEQTQSLFIRFFPEGKFGDPVKPKVGEESEVKDTPNINELADQFAGKVPDKEFSTAELQGYLLEWKQDPAQAVQGVEEWVVHERQVRRARAVREKRRRERAEAARVQEKLDANEAVIMGIGKALADGQGRSFRRHRHYRHPASMSNSSDEESGISNHDDTRMSHSHDNSGADPTDIEPSSPLVNGKSHSPPPSPSSLSNADV